MTAGLQSSIEAAAQCTSYVVGVDAASAPIIGYRLATRGTLGPVTTIKGTVIRELRTVTSSRDFMIEILANVAQNYFDRIVVQTTAGTWRVLSTASAAIFTPGSASVWEWGIGGGSPVWTGASTRGMLIFP